MTKLILSGAVFLCSTVSIAQEVISTQGDSYTNVNANGSIDFTIGETVIFTGTDGTNDLTQGLHQTNWAFVGIDDHVLGYEVSVFPNPMGEVLTVQTETFENVMYKMFDATGRLVLEGNLDAEKTLIQVDQLVSGNYSITLLNTVQNLKTIKLIKY